MAAARAARRTRSADALDPSDVLRWVQRTCSEQGVPVTITDPRVLATVAVLLGPFDGPPPPKPAA